MIDWFILFLLNLCPECTVNVYSISSVQEKPLARQTLLTFLQNVWWFFSARSNDLQLDERKHQSSAPPAFVRGIHRWPVNSPHKGPVTRKMFRLMFSLWCPHGSSSMIGPRTNKFELDVYLDNLQCYVIFHDIWPWPIDLCRTCHFCYRRFWRCWFLTASSPHGCWILRLDWIGFV